MGTKNENIQVCMAVPAGFGVGEAEHEVPHHMRMLRKDLQLAIHIGCLHILGVAARQLVTPRFMIADWFEIFRVVRTAPEFLRC